MALDLRLFYHVLRSSEYLCPFPHSVTHLIYEYAKPEYRAWFWQLSFFDDSGDQFEFVAAIVFGDRFGVSFCWHGSFTVASSWLHLSARERLALRLRQAGSQRSVDEVISAAMMSIFVWPPPLPYEFPIGGSQLDQHFCRWLDIWNEFTSRTCEHKCTP